MAEPERVFAWALARAVLAGIALAGLAAQAAEAAFPPGSNGLIAFTRVGEIWLMNPDGSDPSRLTPGGGPAFSPDGTQIAFYAPDPPDGGDVDIFTIGVDGSNRTNLTPGSPAADYDPAYAPDGGLVFTRHAGSSIDVISMPPDGPTTNLTPGAGIAEVPTVSPDGTEIAFNASDGGDNDIFVMGRDGSAAGNLTSAFTDFDIEPAFSPDGARILFASSRGSTIDLYSMGRDGTDPTAVTAGTPLGERQPVVSPDGSQIGFSATPVGPRGGAPDTDIFVMGADGSNPINLTSTPTQRELDVDWQRLDPIDTDPPETIIDKAPKKKTEKRKAKFGFFADEPATFMCKLDKGDFEPCDASEKFKVKPDKHKLRVQAVDLAGNVDPTPAKRKWKVLEG